jgi:hypothetical protein
LCAGTVDAEVWGLPLVTMSNLRDLLACQFRPNVLDNATTLAGPDSTSVAYPNDDTLYSTAFLDLRAGPQLLNVPTVSGRYVDFQLLDMYTNTIADVGVLTGGGHGGTYAFTGPGWHGTIPKGVVRIDVPTPDAWLLGRTQVKRPADLLAAVELEAQYSLTALSDHGSGTTGGPSTLACPAPALQSSTSLGFLGDLGKDMAADPPMAADDPVVRAMAAAGIGPGRTPGAAGSSNAAEYLKALGLGGRLLAGTAGEGEGSTTIWTGSTRGAVMGSYGTDYLERASLAKETLGTQVPTQAVYFSASRARSGMTTTALAGTRSYEIRFPAEDLPPHGSDGFWSITLYNAAGSLAANPIDRYSIGDDTPGLVRGADRSLTIVVSASRPSETDVNWLPAPRGAFSLVLRVYDPTPQVLDGSWSPPVIRAISWSAAATPGLRISLAEDSWWPPGEASSHLGSVRVVRVAAAAPEERIVGCRILAGRPFSSRWRAGLSASRWGYAPQADGGRVYEPGLRVGGACTGYRMVRPGRGRQAGPRQARGVR